MGKVIFNYTIESRSVNTFIPFSPQNCTIRKSVSLLEHSVESIGVLDCVELNCALEFCNCVQLAHRCSGQDSAKKESLEALPFLAKLPPPLSRALREASLDYSMLTLPKGA